MAEDQIKAVSTQYKPSDIPMGTQYQLKGIPPRKKYDPDTNTWSDSPDQIDPTMDKYFVINGVDSRGKIYSMTLTCYNDAVSAAKESKARLIQVKDSLRRPCGTVTIEHGAIIFTRSVR